MKPVISIIVPLYNSELYLAKCIESILIQNFKNFELILINDGSTDKSGTICATYEKKDSRIKVFHQTNKGVSSARNKGIQESIGKYLCFIDSDDWVHKKYLEGFNLDLDTELQVQNLYMWHEKQDELVAITFSKFGLFDLDSIPMFLEEAEEKQLIRSCYIKLFKLKIIKDNNILFDPNISYCEDYIFVMRYMNYVSTVSVLNEHKYYYAKRENSSLTQSYISFEQRILSFDNVLKLRNLLIRKFGPFSKSNTEYLNSSNSHFLTTMGINLYARKGSINQKKRIKHLTVLKEKKYLELMKKSRRFNKLDFAFYKILFIIHPSIADPILFILVRISFPLIKFKKYFKNDRRLNKKL